MAKADELKRAYECSATTHGVASEEGDHKRANAAHDAIVDAYRQLRTLGNDGLRVLCELMESDNESVRCWAATHCLSIAETKAERVLARLAEGTSVVSFTAEMVLSEWRNGTLEIPGEDKGT